MARHRPLAKPTMRKKPEILESVTIARSRLFRVERIALRFANGAEVDYERLAGSSLGAVLVVPMLNPDTILLIREYAAGTNRYELGFPKGRVEPGEDVFEAANRELMEEIGYGARRLDALRTMTLAPGYLSHTTTTLLARDLYPQRVPGDEPEEIEVVPWPVERIEALLEQEDLTEARSIAALFLTRERLAQGL